jgi:hypothetical protein
MVPIDFSIAGPNGMFTRFGAGLAIATAPCVKMPSSTLARSTDGTNGA